MARLLKCLIRRPRSPGGQRSGYRHDGRAQPVHERPRTVTISLTLHTDYKEFSTIEVVGPGLSRRLEVTDAPVLLRASVTLPPGDSVIRFDAIAGKAHGDPVNRAFRVENYRIAENAP